MQDRLFHELKSLEPAESELDVRVRFRTSLSEGVNRIRIRKPDYFLPVINAFTGPDARSHARVHAWDRHRALLTQRFEDQPLFGEDKAHGITLGQVYQSLRTRWDDELDDERGEASAKSGGPRQYVGI